MIDLFTPTQRGPRRRGAGRLVRAAAATIALVAVAGAPAAGHLAGGQTAPREYPLPTGRSVSPVGTLTTLRSYPTGAAVSPDGHTVIVIAGSFSTGGAADTTAPGAGTALYVVDASTGVVTQMPMVGDAFQSLLFSRDGRRVFVAGASSKAVHVLATDWLGRWGTAVDLPASGYVSGIALNAAETTVWAAEPADNKIERIDLAGARVTASVTVPSPDKLVLSADGSLLFASNWRARTVSVIDTAALSIRSIAVGDHPTALARTPSGAVVVADANDASVATIAPGASTAVITRLAQIGAATDSPNSLTALPDVE